jgi:site-specific recombinase XerD
MKLITASTQYIEYRHSLGFKFHVQGTILIAFAKYAGKDTEMNEITSSLVTEYINTKCSQKQTSYWHSIYSVLYGFFGWSCLRKLIQVNPLPYDKPDKVRLFKPYIYTKEELHKLFNATLTYQRQKTCAYATSPVCIKMILQVTYMLGLRPSETLSIKLSDIHLSRDEMYIVIRETKFYKSRIVPFNEEVLSLLRSFMSWRESYNLSDNPESRLFLTNKEKQIPIHMIQMNFRKICTETGISSHGARFQPSMKDLRHTFATHRVVSWYEEGKDVQTLLPVLSTFMGHCQLDDTAVYITMTDELLSNACRKFEEYNKV